MKEIICTKHSLEEYINDNPKLLIVDNLQINNK
jgi:hypothetical protein